MLRTPEWAVKCFQSFRFAGGSGRVGRVKASVAVVGAATERSRALAPGASSNYRTGCGR